MSASLEGLVTEGTGGQWRVLGPDGSTVVASMRGRLKQGREDDGGIHKLAVGDRVTFEDAGAGAWTITAIHPRRSRLARREPGGRHGERVIAANVDQVVAVFAAANPEPHERMLDRFLVSAEANDITARVVVNKAELVGEAAVRARFAPYVNAGYALDVVSVKERMGLEAVHDALMGRVSVVTGPSGVGKSSLLNAMYPGLQLRVGEVSESVNKGRHTTVGGFLHPLPDGGAIIDTPGLREVGLWGMEPRELEHCFPEFRSVLGTCKFADCAHQGEPGCALMALVGHTVTAARFDSFQHLRAEVAAATGRR
ncbi:MAG: ribosome small subunit-dependent GTPase A [Gemmatimonadetes bacterium]|nr:ribosome small subunit-dependent GTPase A [Gemmatimonadota bacterium]